MYQDTCVVQGKEYKAVSIEYNSSSCEECAFLLSFQNCKDAGSCAKGVRKDERNIIWLLKENN